MKNIFKSIWGFLKDGIKIIIVVGDNNIINKD